MYHMHTHVLTHSTPRPPTALKWCVIRIHKGAAPLAAWIDGYWGLFVQTDRLGGMGMARSGCYCSHKIKIHVYYALWAVDALVMAANGTQNRVRADGMPLTLVCRGGMRC